MYNRVDWGELMKVKLLKGDGMNFRGWLRNDLKNFVSGIFKGLGKCSVMYDFKYMIKVRMMIWLFKMNV